MGFYRLLLAFFVVTGHVGISILGYDPGVVAVVSFFLMSGYVMTGLIDRHYGNLRYSTSVYVQLRNANLG